MRAKLLITAALTAAPLIWGAPAHADLIGIGGATGTVSFTKNGSPATGTLSFTTTGFTATNLATFQSPTGTVVDTGTAIYGAMSGTTGPISGGVFPILTGGTQSFSYNSATNHMTGTIQYGGIKDNTNTPDFDVNATLTVLTSSGSALFTSDFPVGGVSTTDFTVDLPTTCNGNTPCTLTVLSSTASATFSSGEVTSTAAVVPEPASLTLLGSALVGLGWFARRRRNRV